MITFYHKSNCIKSNEVYAYLRASGKRFKVVHYLENPPSPDQIKALLKKMNLDAPSWVRRKEPLYQNTYSAKIYSEEEWISILHENPILMERPVLEKKTTAIIGRPFEKAKRFIDGKRNP